MSPARSSTFRCFEIAGWLMRKGFASSITPASPLLPPLALPRLGRRRQLRGVLNRQHVGPAGAGIAARLVPVVLREEHDTLEIGEPHEQLKGRGADVPVVLGALVAPSVISE